MNLQARYKTEIDIDAIRCVNQLNCESQPVPSLEELKRFIDINGLKIKVLILFEDNTCVGLAIYYQENRRVSGITLNTYSILGYTLYDYNALYYKKGYLKALLAEIRKDAKNNNVDAIVFDNLVNNCQEENIPSALYTKTEALIFDSRNEENGYDYILAKKKLRKRFERLKRRNKYSCTNAIGEITEQDMQMISDMHQERWAFDSVESAFNDPLRKQLYKAYPGNKLLTKITLNNELFAIHYGMVYNDTALFHTPIINIKYLDLSPLQTLIYETAKFCSENNIEIYDFGLGDEPYKDRYCNTSRKISHIFIAISVKAYFSKFLFQSLSKKKQILQEGFIKLKKLKHKLLAKFVKVSVFAVDTSNFDINKSDNDLIYQEISDFSELVDLARQYGFEVRKLFYDRLKDENTFFCLIKNKKIVSFGWGSEADSFYVGENDTLVDNSGKLLLYDFVTEEQERGKGYYPKLLKNIVVNNKEKVIEIMSLASNSASIRGILKAGFYERN